MLNWTSFGRYVYCNDEPQFLCVVDDDWDDEERAIKKAEHFVRILAALEAMHTLTRDATDNREELIP